MRPLVFLSIATAKRLSHSCWASLSVAVPVLITIVLVSWAAAPPAAAPMSAATSPRPRAHAVRRAVIALLLVIDFPLWLVEFSSVYMRNAPPGRQAGSPPPGRGDAAQGIGQEPAVARWAERRRHRGRLLNRPSAVDKLGHCCTRPLRAVTERHP